MDNLRAIAMLVGVIFHAALAYSPLMSNLWLAADPQHSAIVDIVAWFLHLFRMPVFFVIAGFFALMLIERKGMSNFLKNRAKRVLLPFIIFLPLILAAIIGGIVWAVSNVENPSPLLQWITAMGKEENAQKPPLSTMHLWFLFNLCWFYLVASLLVKFNFFNSTMATTWFCAKSIVFIFPLLLVPSLLTQFAPHPAAERVYPELWSFGFYGQFFILGMIIFNNKKILEELKIYSRRMLVASIFGYILFYIQLPDSLTMQQALAAVNGIEFSWQHLLVACLEAYVAVYMTIVCVILAKRWLNGKNRFFRYFSDASYWVYIVHLPVLFFIQYLLLDYHWNLWVEFFISSTATIVVGMLSYILLVRSTPLGSLLNGKRMKFLG